MKRFGVLLMLVGMACAVVERRDIAYLEMSDGVKLHTRITFPKDFKDGDKRTVVIDRSPYSEFGIELLAYLFLPAGFIAVTQDMRGTALSGGHWSNWQSDANDSTTTGDWIIQQDWSDGQVYSFGASADGLGAFTTNLNSPSWLKSQYLIWTSSIGYEVLYPNGALLEDLLHNWIYSTVRDQDVDAAYAEFMENEAKTEWWETLDFTGNYDLIPKEGKFGFWAGWYDIFLVGNLAAYNGFNYESDPAVQGNSVLLVDPCGHCQDAAEFFSEDLVAGRTALGLMQAYDVYGVRPVARTDIKNVTFYVMSSNDDAGKEAGQFWTTMERFPEPVATKFYLHGDGSASTTAPTAATGGAAESASYLYDPANPIKTNGGNNLFSSAPCGPLEQQEIDLRDDVLVYQTAVMEEALPLTGAINAQLWVSSSAIDTDFMVRVSDVYPTGEARLLQDSAARMRWREGGLEPVFMNNGTVYPATLSLWNTSYIVAPGHALRFAISSSNAPRFSVNPNNGLLLADAGYPGENIVATNTIWHSEKYPSYVELPVVTLSQLPEVHDLKGQFQRAYPDIDYDLAMKEGPKLLEMLASVPRRAAAQAAI